MSDTRSKYLDVASLAAGLAAACLTVAAMTVSSFYEIRLYLLASTLIVLSAAAIGWRHGARWLMVSALALLALSWLPFALIYFFMLRF